MVFDTLPTDVDAQFLSGAAKFVASEGELTEGMGKRDFVWALNELAGVARIESDGEGRSTQEIVETGEADGDALAPEQYTNNIFEDELEAWASAAMADAEIGSDE